MLYQSTKIHSYPFIDALITVTSGHAPPSSRVYQPSFRRCPSVRKESRWCEASAESIGAMQKNERYAYGILYYDKWYILVYALYIIYGISSKMVYHIWYFCWYMMIYGNCWIYIYIIIYIYMIYMSYMSFTL